MNRKRKLRLIQLSLLILGSIIIFLTYSDKQNLSDKQLVPKETQEKVKKQLAQDDEKGDVFFNISYSGLDLAGNRYILKSKEARYNEKNQEVVIMKFVEAIFYFKDSTTLRVLSDNGIYNNKTLDMTFDGNVNAFYEESELFAQRAEYSNTKSYLTILNNVKVKDSMGTMVADKLLFDIKKQKLNIASFNDGKINANIRLK
tara:strand:+ start:2930 stop:3532 length:603 start_codon:yes stop_codon:yes gene_type:complete